MVRYEDRRDGLTLAETMNEENARDELLYAIRAEATTELPFLLYGDKMGTLTDRELIQSVRQCIESLTDCVEALERVEALR